MNKIRTNMDRVRKDGYVRSLNRTELMEIFKKNPQDSEAIQYLEDGLGYLNYAKLGSDRGYGDPEKDYEAGIGFIKTALDVLRGDLPA
jgi:hypothetical protein